MEQCNESATILNNSHEALSGVALALAAVDFN